MKHAKRCQSKRLKQRGLYSMIGIPMSTLTNQRALFDMFSLSDLTSKNDCKKHPGFLRIMLKRLTCDQVSW